jgi:ribonuclease-3 family protein
LANIHYDKKNLETLFDFSKIVSNKNEIPTDVLAFVGDSFFNMVATFHSIGDGRMKTAKAFKKGVKHKRASGQRKFLEKIEALLTVEELEVVKKGLNSKGAKKRGNDYDYRYSTAFETLVGYLFLKREWERLDIIFSECFK